MTKKQPPKAAIARRSATVTLVVLLLIFALALGALALWHSGALLSSVSVLRSANAEVDGAIYSVCYGDIYAALAEDATQDADLRDEAIEQTEEKLSRALVFYGLAKAEGKLDSYGDYVREAGERALAALRETASVKGKSESAYIKSRYGRGVRAKDVARTAEFFAVASLREAELTEKIYTAEERETAFEAHRAELLLADCIVYSVKAQYAPSATPDEMRDAYLEAESRAQKIAASSDKAAFLSAIQADFRAVNAATTSDAVNAMTNDAYRYHISPSEDDLVARWVREAARTAGDTAVLGANGDYTVVYCLSPAAKQTANTANFWQMLYPVAQDADRDAAYMEALDIFGAMSGIEDYRDRAEQVGDVRFVRNAWRAELAPEVADWLDRSPRRDESSLIETEDGYVLVCFDSLSELAVWEKQAIAILQEAEFDSLHEAAEVRSVSLGRMFLLL
ncbi:MAG: hypothetical protein IJ009_03835 [Clostridia bacterium]|nr:hypothetical protein [Clostridia bacterium]